MFNFTLLSTLQSQRKRRKKFHLGRVSKDSTLLKKSNAHNGMSHLFFTHFIVEKNRARKWGQLTKERIKRTESNA